MKRYSRTCRQCGSAFRTNCGIKQRFCDGCKRATWSLRVAAEHALRLLRDAGYEADIHVAPRSTVVIVHSPEAVALLVGAGYNPQGKASVRGDGALRIQRADEQQADAQQTDRKVSNG